MLLIPRVMKRFTNLQSAFSYASDFEEERMNSYFGRLTYNFKEKYMFETTIRRDGSSVSEKSTLGNLSFDCCRLNFRKNPSETFVVEFW